MPSAGKTLSFLLRRRQVAATDLAEICWREDLGLPSPAVWQFGASKRWMGIFYRFGYRTHRKGYWEEDPGQKTNFPPGSTVHDVVARMITILQDAARK
jgi:hypothetical protein